MPDQNFDPLAERFAKRIYGSEKGAIRLAIIKQQLQHDFPELLSGRPLRILDIGAGMGQVALWLAALGHQVHVVEPSLVMMEKACAEFVEAGYAVSRQATDSLDEAPEGLSLHTLGLQQLPESWRHGFDLVVFHAVMEWLELPFDGLARACQLVKPGGGISVMFYNRNSLVFRNVIRGNLRKVASADFRGEEGGLTPQNPLLPEQVEQALEGEGIRIEGQCGVRVFTDYMQKGPTISLQDKLAMEQAWCRKQPFVFMARYVMFNGRRKLPD